MKWLFAILTLGCLVLTVQTGRAWYRMEHSNLVEKIRHFEAQVNASIVKELEHTVQYVLVRREQNRSNYRMMLLLESAGLILSVTGFWIQRSIDLRNERIPSQILRNAPPMDTEGW